MGGHVAVAEASAVGHSLVAVINGVGNGVEEVGIELIRVVWDCTEGNDGLGGVLQVVGYPPHCSGVLRVGVVLI